MLDMFCKVGCYRCSPWRSFKVRSIRMEKERVGFTIPMTAYVLVVIFVATLIRSTFGFGEALIAVPLLALRLPVNIAAPLAVLVSTVIAGVVLVQDWRHVELRSAVGLILSALPGIPLGVLLLARGNQHVVKSVLGILIIGFSIYSLRAGTARRLSENHSAWLLGCGFLSGVLGGAYGMNGPPLAVYGALQKWTPQHFRATLQGYFLPASLVGGDRLCCAGAVDGAADTILPIVAARGGRRGSIGAHD